MAQRQFIIDGGFKTDDASELLANLTMGGSILPNVDSNGTTGFDLGSPTAKWKDLYLSQGSLYIDGQKVLESDSGTIVVQADVDQGITVKSSGTGVLSLQSATTVNMAGTLQMGAGKNITDVSGVAVGFGDKIDMNNNNIINVGTAVNATDVANKSYVDLQVSNLVNGAPGALDTLNELANALADDAAFSTTITNSVAANAAAIVATNSSVTSNATQIAANLAASTASNIAIATKANTTYVDAQDASQLATLQTYADTAETDAILAASLDATTKADAAQLAAVSTAVATAESKDVARMVTSDAYADASEAAAVATASADATSKANAAQSAAISSASSDATTKANAAQAAAISTASSDATTKANAAQAAAVSAVTNGAGAAFDTLKEIQDAMATDTELSTAISNVTSSAASTAAADATTKADAALAAAKVYADANDANTTYSVGNGGLTEVNFTSADNSKLDGIAASATNVTNNNQISNGAGYITSYVDTNTTYTAGNGMSLSGTEFLMSGSYTGSFTATGDITAYSDDSLKTNVQVIDGALGKVEAIRGVTFERIEDGSVSTGVIAQELKAVLPEAVHTDAEGIHSVAYGNITGLLIEAVKELSAQVAELKAK
jgi:uncharacterized protein YunC (DUF1805 family)